MVTRIGPRPLPDAMLCKAKREEAKATQYYDILILIFPLMILTLSVPGIGLSWLRMRNCGYASIHSPPDTKTEPFG